MSTCTDSQTVISISDDELSGNQNSCVVTMSKQEFLTNINEPYCALIPKLRNIDQYLENPRNVHACRDLQSRRVWAPISTKLEEHHFKFISPIMRGITLDTRGFSLDLIVMHNIAMEDVTQKPRRKQAASKTCDERNRSRTKPSEFSVHQ